MFFEQVGAKAIRYGASKLWFISKSNPKNFANYRPRNEISFTTLLPQIFV